VRDGKRKILLNLAEIASKGVFEKYRADPFRAIDDGLLYIQTKAALIVRLVPNPIQADFLQTAREMWHAGVPVRIIVLKARQQGLSTISTAMLFCIVVFSDNVQGTIIADVMENAIHLYEMVDRYQSNVNTRGLIDDLEIVEPPKIWNTRQMKWETKQSRASRQILLNHSRNKSAGVSKTLRLVIQSELSRFVLAMELEAGLLAAIPDLARTFWIKESTAFGAGGLFYMNWLAAIPGPTGSGFVRKFYPWIATPEYDADHEDSPLTIPEDFKPTQEELRLIKIAATHQDVVQWGPLTPGKLTWRRAKIAAYNALPGGNGLRKFKENYPLTPEEAFIVSGDLALVGCGEIAKRRLEEIPLDFGTRGMLKEVVPGRILFVPNETEEAIFTVFEKPIRGEEYVHGSDVGEGVSEGAFSAGSVFRCRTRQQVAVIRCRYPTDQYALEMRKLAMYYNGAPAAPECNSIGVAVVNILRNTYDNLFHMDQLDALTYQTTKKWGWNTTTSTLHMMEATFARFLREEAKNINDRTTLSEVLTYIIDPDKPSTHCPREGYYSDALIGAMITVMLLPLGEIGEALPPEADPGDYEPHQSEEEEQSVY